MNGGDGGITAEEEMEEGEVRHGGGANVQGGRWEINIFFHLFILKHFLLFTILTV